MDEWIVVWIMSIEPFYEVGISWPFIKCEMTQPSEYFINYFGQVLVILMFVCLSTSMPNMRGSVICLLFWGHCTGGHRMILCWPIGSITFCLTSCIPNRCEKKSLLILRVHRLMWWVDDSLLMSARLCLLLGCFASSFWISRRMCCWSTRPVSTSWREPWRNPTASWWAVRSVCQHHRHPARRRKKLWVGASGAGGKNIWNVQNDTVFCNLSEF